MKLPRHWEWYAVGGVAFLLISRKQAAASPAANVVAIDTGTLQRLIQTAQAGLQFSSLPPQAQGSSTPLSAQAQAPGDSSPTDPSQVERGFSPEYYTQSLLKVVR